MRRKLTVALAFLLTMAALPLLKNSASTAGTFGSEIESQQKVFELDLDKLRSGDYLDEVLIEIPKSVDFETEIYNDWEFPGLNVIESKSPMKSGYGRAWSTSRNGNPIYRCQVEDMDAVEMAKALRIDRRVIKAEPTIITRLDTQDSTELPAPATKEDYENQWSLRSTPKAQGTGIEEAVQQYSDILGSTTDPDSKPKKISIIMDSGIRYSERSSKFLLDGYSAQEQMAVPAKKSVDPNGHGTFLDGEYGHDNNRVGTISDTIFGANGTTDSATELQAIDFVETLPETYPDSHLVVNASWGGSLPSDVLHDKIAGCVGMGILWVAATGNQSSSEIFYPAAWPEVISVTSNDKNGELSWFSNAGSAVTISTAGNFITSWLGKGKYVTSYGTSFSVPPVVIGVLAIEEMGIPAKNVAAMIEANGVPDAQLTGDDVGSNRLDLVVLLKAAQVAASFFYNLTCNIDIELVDQWDRRLYHPKHRAQH